MEDDSCDSWPVYLGIYPDEDIFVTHLRTGWVAWCAIVVPLRVSLFLLKIDSYTNCSCTKSLSAWVTQTMKIAMGYRARSTKCHKGWTSLCWCSASCAILLGKSSLDKTPGDTNTITSQKYMRGSCSSIDLSGPQYLSFLQSIDTSRRAKWEQTHLSQDMPGTEELILKWAPLRW